MNMFSFQKGNCPEKPGRLIRLQTHQENLLLICIIAKKTKKVNGKQAFIC